MESYRLLPLKSERLFGESASAASHAVCVALAEYNTRHNLCVVFVNAMYKCVMRMGH